MIEAAVFKSVLKVVDKFTELLKFRHERRREFFTTVLEPLFDDLMVMHTDYLKMFGECLAQLDDEKVTHGEIAKDLARRRLLYEGVRIKARAFSNALYTTEIDEPYKLFLMASADHVPDGTVITEFPTSVSTDLLQKIYESELSKIGDEEGRSQERGILAQKVTQAADEIRQRWSDICELYVKAKVWSLK